VGGRTTLCTVFGFPGDDSVSFVAQLSFFPGTKARIDTNPIVAILNDDAISICGARTESISGACIASCGVTSSTTLAVVSRIRVGCIVTTAGFSALACLKESAPYIGGKVA